MSHCVAANVAEAAVLRCPVDTSALFVSRYSR